MTFWVQNAQYMFADHEFVILSRNNVIYPQTCKKKFWKRKLFSMFRQFSENPIPTATVQRRLQKNSRNSTKCPHF